MMKVIYKYSIVLAVFCALFFAVPKTASAQETDYQCIGNALAEYMNEVVELAGGLEHVKLFSPAFNMTNPIGTQIATEMITAGANFEDLHGIAGNAYNFNGDSVTDHVGNFLTVVNTLLIHPKRVLITETGMIEGSLDDLERELSTIKDDDAQYFGALLFNALGGRPELGTEDVNWDAFELTDAEINTLCGGDCSRLGVNSAIYYRGERAYYSHAGNGPGGLNMQYTLSIANLDESTIEGVIDAHNYGLTPVVRLGTANDTTGPSAYDYASFLIELDGEVDNEVYAIAGPNEPQSECWAYASECGCDGLTPIAPIGPNLGRRPLNEGFDLGRELQCHLDSQDDFVNDEFHPLRPYPVNACDPLIPQSLPEATSNVRNKYNTYACGTSINFRHSVGFDPYYDVNTGGIITSPATGEGYIEMVCDPDPSTYTCITNPCPPVTCYRTIRYEIETDFRDTNIGILGNTQNDLLTDAQKVNNYLSWYFVGTPQTGDHEPLDKLSIQDMDTLVNYSGPLRKLLPLDSQNAMRSVIATAYRDGGPESNWSDLHNYEVGCRDVLTIGEVWDALEDLLGRMFDAQWKAVRFAGRFIGWEFENAISMGEALIYLAQRPHLFEPENRQELIDELAAQGQDDFARHREFIDDLIELGRANVFIVGSFLRALESDHAISCSAIARERIRFSDYEDLPYPAGRLPPNPLNYYNFRHFWRIYNNWRGLTNVPLIGPRDWINPWVNQNLWAELFPHIPLGGLEDIAGEVHPSIDEYDVGAAVGPGGFTAPPQLNIVEAEPAQAIQQDF